MVVTHSEPSLEEEDTVEDVNALLLLLDPIIVDVLVEEFPEIFLDDEEEDD